VNSYAQCVSFAPSVIYTIYTKFIDKIQKKFKNCHQNDQLILTADSRLPIQMNPENIIKSKVYFSQEKINPALYGEQSRTIGGA
jgi:hypothetical protein